MSNLVCVFTYYYRFLSSNHPNETRNYSGRYIYGPVDDSGWMKSHGNTLSAVSPVFVFIYFLLLGVGMGKTVKEKVCVHTSRDIRAIASQLVNVWLEVFRKEKASNGGLKLPKQTTVLDLSKRKSAKDSALGKPPLGTYHGTIENKGGLLNPTSAGSNSPSHAHMKKLQSKQGRQPAAYDSRHEVSSSKSKGSIDRVATEKEDSHCAISEEEQAAIAAAEAARAKALAAAEVCFPWSFSFNVTSLLL